MEMILEKAPLSVVQINYLDKSALHYYVNAFMLADKHTLRKGQKSLLRQTQRTTTGYRKHRSNTDIFR